VLNCARVLDSVRVDRHQGFKSCDYLTHRHVPLHQAYRRILLGPNALEVVALWACRIYKHPKCQLDSSAQVLSLEM
jgi:hypothetical protein